MTLTSNLLQHKAKTKAEGDGVWGVGGGVRTESGGGEGHGREEKLKKV